MSRKDGTFWLTLPLREMLEEEFVKQKVAERLIEARESRDLGQEQAARRIEIGVRSYQRWENRENLPSRRSRRKILDKLGVDLEDLFPKDGGDGVVELLQGMDAKLDLLIEGADAEATLRRVLSAIAGHGLQPLIDEALKPASKPRKSPRKRASNGNGTRGEADTSPAPE